MAYLILCKTTGVGSALTPGYRTLTGSDSHDEGHGITTDGSTGVYITGYSQWNSEGDNDAVLAKYSLNGDIQWQRQLGGSSSDIGEDLAVDSSGNVYLVGTTFLGATPGVMLVKYNSSGVIQWQQILVGTGSSNGYGIHIDNSNNIYVSGHTKDNTTGGDDLYVAKCNSSGVIQWQRILGTNVNEYGGHNLAVDGSGNVYISGKVYDGSDSDIVIAKYNSSGTFQWARKLNNTASGGSNGNLDVDSSGNVYLACPTGSATGIVAKYNTSGVIQWQREISNSNVYLQSIYITDSDDIYIGGYGNNDALIVKYNTSGVIQWQRTIASANIDVVQGITVDNYNNIYVVGDTREPVYKSILMAKMSANMTFPTTIGAFTYNTSSFTETVGSLTDESITLTSDTGSLSVSTTNLTDKAGTFTFGGTWE